MRRFAAFVFVLGSFGLYAIPSVAGAASDPPGRYIVVLEDSVSDPGAVAQQHGRAHRAEVSYVYGSALKGYAATIPADRLDDIRSDPRVAYVEADAPVYATEVQQGAPWGLDRIDQRSQLPLDGFNYTNTGAGVTAYVIDTGIVTSHSEFGGRAKAGSDGFDAFSDGRNGQDCNGHGTHVAGTIGGTTFGVAKGVTLVAVRVLNCKGSGTTAGVIAGVNWVTGHHQDGRPAVANMSLGGGASTALDDAVRASIVDGVSYAVAAGNGDRRGVAQDACKSSPAGVSEAMTIGATDNLDRKASWSNYGTCVDWFAPGVNILSAWYDRRVTNATKTISGTSMATPHTAGVAALYLQSTSDASPAVVRDALFAKTTKGIVTSATVNNHLLFTDL
jgi:subtilisin family serine protease